MILRVKHSLCSRVGGPDITGHKVTLFAVDGPRPFRCQVWTSMDQYMQYQIGTVLRWDRHYILHFLHLTVTPHLKGHNHSCLEFDAILLWDLMKMIIHLATYTWCNQTQASTSTSKTTNPSLVYRSVGLG